MKKQNFENQSCKNNEGKLQVHSKNRRLLIIVITVTLFAVLCTYVGISTYYKEHFFRNTVINGVNVSHMTVEEAEKAINAQVRSYSLTISQRKDRKELITGDHIDLHSVFNDSLDIILEEQKEYSWPFNLTKKHDLEVEALLEYDESLLQSTFDNLKCFSEEIALEPKDAYISEYGENGYEIIPEDPGAKVKKELVYEAVKDAIMALKPSISIEELGGYEDPKITSEDPRLNAAVAEMNKMASAVITYEFGEDIEVLDGKKISEWISVNKDYEVSLNVEGVKEFVDYIGWAYNTFGRIRTFQTSYGETLKISGGDYGWWLNRGKELSELTELIKEGKQLHREPAYFQTARQYGKDDIGDTYVEVNLSAQHLFFYKEGELILETDFVSGNLAKNYGTPTGTYPIQYKENDAILNGEDYSTPVKYWMPFNGNIGFHDASWRSEFGKDIYLTNGSHGCINMPPAAAKVLFENISRGIPVIVYELPGTENYEVEDKESKDKDHNKKEEVKEEKNTEEEKIDEDDTN